MQRQWEYPASDLLRLRTNAQCTLPNAQHTLPTTAFTPTLAWYQCLSVSHTAQPQAD